MPYITDYMLDFSQTVWCIVIQYQFKYLFCQPISLINLGDDKKQIELWKRNINNYNGRWFEIVKSYRFACKIRLEMLGVSHIYQED